MRVDIEHVRKLQEERMKINSAELKDIEWYEDGEKVEIDPKTLEDFRFTGLCNTDFIIYDAYREKNGLTPRMLDEGI